MRATTHQKCEAAAPGRCSGFLSCLPKHNMERSNVYHDYRPKFNTN
jgi:hypothetical protein